MIFPVVRLSELRNDVALKKLRLDESAGALRSAVVSKTTVSGVLKHPGLLIGGLVSTVAAFKISKKLVGFLMNTSIEGRWAARIATFGGTFLLRKLTPLATKGALFALKQFAKRKSA